MELGKGCKCLVTGGAGFIGSHICEELVNLGCDVTSIDNYSAGKQANLRHLKLHEVACDVLDFSMVKRYMKGVDVVFHNAASKKNICLKDPRKDLDVNAKGTYNVLEAAREYGVKKVVHASTGSVYGEAQFLPQTEQHPLEPCSYYGVSKLAGESYCKTFAKLYDMDITILRYFHVYGPRQESGEFGGVIAIWINKLKNGYPIVLHGDGEQQRSFTFVKDVVNANLKAVNYKGGIFNCASGINYTLNEVIMDMWNITKIQPVIQYLDWQIGDIKIFDINNSLIKRELGITFLTDFKKGLEKTWTL